MKETTFHKNEQFEVVFEDLTHEGFGVAKINGFPVFVADALVGERALIALTKVKKSFAYGRMVFRYTKSPDRVEAPCRFFKLCGGCTLQHLSYPAQLAYKQKQVAEVLKRIGYLENITVCPTQGMGNPWNYRNKSQVPVASVDGQLEIGFYRQRTHQMIPMDTCLIQSETNDQILQWIKQISSQLGVEPYDEQKHTGVLRHIMLREAKATGEVMVVLVTRTKVFPEGQALVKKITKRYPMVQSIVQNINPQKTNVILGEQTKLLHGRKYIYDYIGSVKFAISALSFYQINPIQTKVLYEQVLHYAGLTGNEVVFDVYSGVGTISLFLAQKAKAVYGVEIVEAAVENAKQNAKLNGMDNVRFEVGKAETVIPQWICSGIQPDVIVVDPPRKGCDKHLLQTMLTASPSRMVYVSCNPATLARDLQILTATSDYKVKEVQPVDMFAQTGHVETVVLMSKVKE